jgi:probable DNA metabolism protein
MAVRSVTLPQECGEDTFRRIARSCLAQGLHPDDVVFDTDGTGSLFEPAEPRDAPAILMPRRLVDIVSDVVCHSAEDRFALLYRLLWRIHAGERHLLDRAADPDVQRAQRYAKAVERDVYRMHAFVRFAERRSRIGPCSWPGSSLSTECYGRPRNSLWIASPTWIG